MAAAWQAAAWSCSSLGAVRQPFPDGLKVGDTVRVEIDGIGSLSNSIVAEPEGFVAPPPAAESTVRLLDTAN